MMYLLSETEQHVHSSLRDAILLLCQTGLKFDTELSVDGLLAVTVDKKHVFLLSIKETLQANKPCNTVDDIGYVCTGENQEVLNFSSACPSTVTSVGDHMMSEDSTRSISMSTEMQHHCADATTQQRVLSVSKSHRIHRGRHRKSRHTVCRTTGAECLTTSPSAASESLGQSEHVPLLVANENIDMLTNSEGEIEHCNDEIADHQVTVPAVAISTNSSDQTASNCGDQDCGEDFGSVPVEEQKQCESETSDNLAQTNKQLVINSDLMSSQNHDNQRHQCLDSSTYPTTSSSELFESLSQTGDIPGWVDNEELTPSKVENDHYRVENADIQPDNGHIECPASFDLSASVKSEVDDSSSVSMDVVSQLASLEQNLEPSSNPLQRVAVSQFGLSAVVASMQSHLALLPKPFPWSLGTFPSLSPPYVPPAECGMLVGPPSSLAVNSNAKNCRHPKTPLNIPTINSYRRLNGVKNSPFLSPEVNVCANCGVTRTTVWRRMENKQILCNACGCYYKLHKEIRSRCRGPKMSTLLKASKSRYNGVVMLQQSSPDVALNLTMSSHKDKPI